MKDVQSAAAAVALQCVGGIGHAIARRQGPGRSVVLADFNESTLDTAAKSLEAAGHHVATQRVDVSVRESVRALTASFELLV